MRIVALLLLAQLACAALPKPDPTKVGKALDALEEASRAVNDAIEATRDAVPPQPEQPAEEERPAMESVPVQAEPLPE